MDEPSFRQQVDGPPPKKRQRTVSHNQRAAVAGKSPQVMRKGIDEFGRSVAGMRVSNHPWDRSSKNPTVWSPLVAVAITIALSLIIYGFSGGHISIPEVLLSLVVGIAAAVVFEMTLRHLIGNPAEKKPGVRGPLYALLLLGAIVFMVGVGVAYAVHYQDEQSRLNHQTNNRPEVHQFDGAH